MNKANITIKGEENYYIKEIFNALRTNVQLCGKNNKVIAVTSSFENEGKTTISLKLAASFAEAGKKVLFVDADLRKSVLASRLSDVICTNGVSEVLTGQKAISECIYETQKKNLFVIFSGAVPPNAAELLSSSYFQEFLEELKKDYEYIIVDTPPAGVIIDATIIAQSCDGIIFVSRGEYVHARKLRPILDQLKKSGTPILGIVRNLFVPKKMK